MLWFSYSNECFLIRFAVLHLELAIEKVGVDFTFSVVCASMQSKIESGECDANLKWRFAAFATISMAEIMAPENAGVDVLFFFAHSLSPPVPVIFFVCAVDIY